MIGRGGRRREKGDEGRKKRSGEPFMYIGLPPDPLPNTL
jgi:hypothetical protein